MADNVKVAVRVRPLNQREHDRGSTPVVSMEANQTVLVNPTTGEERRFTFDYCYMSMDPDAANYASQQTVFNDLGYFFLDNAWAGYNCSIFAYGQTGSGKSYSMTGYGKDRGIIPLGCEELFNRIEENEEPDVSFRIEVSFLEIYNEQIRDLFNPKGSAGDGPGGKGGGAKGKKNNGLRIRQSPSTGIYVEGLQRIAVSSYKDIETLMNVGAKARTVASTAMNAESSRSHSVFTIYFTKTVVDKETMSASDKASKVNLVDLAGSERANSTGATGDRLKEGCAINKSLSALGNVISALASGKKVVPYRDSSLTRLLQESLGGNAKTIMIAALSPADINYDETMSTLRYADRAKQIVNQAIINENPNDKLIRELREEVMALRAMLGAGGGATSPVPGSAPGSSGAGVTTAAGEDVHELKQRLAQSEEQIRSMNMTWEEKMQNSALILKQGENVLEAAGISINTDPSRPHLVNLNEDPILSETLFYYLRASGETVFGRKPKANPDAEAPHVPLSGLNIVERHARLRVPDPESTDVASIMLTVGDGALVFVNGNKLEPGSEHAITHNDRIVMGNNHYFRLVDPPQRALLKASAEQDGTPYTEPDYAYARQELTARDMQAMKAEVETEAQARIDELTRSMAEKEAQLQAEKEAATAALQEQQRELERRAREMEQQAAEAEAAMARQADAQEKEQMQRELEEMQAKMEEEKAAALAEVEARTRELEQRNHEMEAALAKQRQEAAVKKRQVMQRNLQEQELMRILPLVSEANAYATEMQRGLTFASKLQTHINAGTRERTTEVLVTMFDHSTGVSAIWSADKFTNRIYLMREMYALWCEDPDDFVVAQRDDPFWDPPEDQLIGRAAVFLESVAACVEMDFKAQITDYAGKSKGDLLVELVPCTNDGQPDPPDDEWAEVGTSLAFLLRVTSARGIPAGFNSGTYIRYQFWDDPDPVVSERCQAQTINPVWSYERLINVASVTPDFLAYLENNALSIEVWGAADMQEELPQPSATPTQGVDRLKNASPFGMTGVARRNSIASGRDSAGSSSRPPIGQARRASRIDDAALLPGQVATSTSAAISRSASLESLIAAREQRRSFSVPPGESGSARIPAQVRPASVAVTSSPRTETAMLKQELDKVQAEKDAEIEALRKQLEQAKASSAASDGTAAGGDTDKQGRKKKKKKKGGCIIV